MTLCARMFSQNIFSDDSLQKEEVLEYLSELLLCLSSRPNLHLIEMGFNILRDNVSFRND